MPEKKVTLVEFPPRQTVFNAHASKKRVAAYARVSTAKDEQENSLSAQMDYFEKYIRANPQWTFAGIYSDEGISGLSCEKRDSFNRMVQDALTGKIDLIITKSLSRFARNTVDSLTVIRKLKDKGVSVYFEKEAIDTLDAKGEFLITLMSSFAEEESRSISENITWGIRKRFADGKYSVAYSQFLGYRRGKTGNMLIDKNEAKVVRFIYMLALEGRSTTDICKVLMNCGIQTPAKKDEWQANVVLSILTNEKYKGDALLQKEYTVDFIAKVMKENEGELPKYYVKNGHPAIISEEAWNEVQAIWSQTKSVNNTSHPLGDRIICCDCKGLMGRKVWHSTTMHDIVWECNNRKANRTDCRRFHIYDSELQSCVVRAMYFLLHRYKDILNECLDVYRSALGTEPEVVRFFISRFMETSPEDILFDNSMVRVLIASINVTPNYNLVFHFIDGRSFRCRYGNVTPKGKLGMYDSVNRHEKMLALSDAGYSATEISDKLKISVSTVYTYLWRHRTSAENLGCLE